MGFNQTRKPTTMYSNVKPLPATQAHATYFNNAAGSPRQTIPPYVANAPRNGLATKQPAVQKLPTSSTPAIQQIVPQQFLTPPPALAAVTNPNLVMAPQPVAGAMQGNAGILSDADLAALNAKAEQQRLASLQQGTPDPTMPASFYQPISTGAPAQQPIGNQLPAQPMLGPVAPTPPGVSIGQGPAPLLPDGAYLDPTTGMMVLGGGAVGQPIMTPMGSSLGMSF